jgi:hypothetical protein
MCMLGIGMWFGKHNYYRKMFSKPASVIVGTFGAIWFFQRIASLF